MPAADAPASMMVAVIVQLHQEMRSTLTTMQRIQEDLRRGVGLPNARCTELSFSLAREKRRLAKI